MKRALTIVRFLAGAAALGYLVQKDVALALAVWLTADFIYFWNKKFYP